MINILKLYMYILLTIFLYFKKACIFHILYIYIYIYISLLFLGYYIMLFVLYLYKLYMSHTVSHTYDQMKCIIILNVDLD